MRKLVLIFLFVFLTGLDAQQEIDSVRIYRETFLTEISREDSLNTISDFVSSVDALLSNKYARGSDHSVVIYSLDQKKFLYHKNINKLLTPASNTKLFTSFAALWQFSRDFFVTTEVFTDGNLKDSTLNGNIYIVGHGDGMLSISDLEYLADEIKNLGIREITGNVYADGSYFDSILQREEYANDKDRVVDLPPITALSIEKNEATVLVKSGSRAGKYVDVQLIPDSESFAKWITAKVRGYKRGEVIGDEDNTLVQPQGSARYGDELFKPVSYNARSVRVSSKISSKNGKQLFTVSGYLYPNRSRAYRFHIQDPVLATAGAFKQRLMGGGINVNGTIGKADIDTLNKIIFLAEFGRPLMEIIKKVNKDSDNYLAENLFKMVGASSGLDSITARATNKVTKTSMLDLEIPFQGCLLNDGSGLSRRNLLTTGAIINLLIRVDELGWYNDYVSTLSIAGVDGTLEKRMRRTNAENNLRGKTGTLRNASALSGYVNTVDGERLAFSIIFNGRYISKYKELENQLGVLMSQFFYYNVSN